MTEHISITEASRRFGVSDRTLRNWVKWGWLSADRAIIEGRAHQLINVAALQALIKARGLQEHTGKPERSGMTVDTAEIIVSIDELRWRFSENQAALESLERRIEALEKAVRERPNVMIESVVKAQKTLSASSQREIVGGSLPPGYVGAEGFKHNIPGTTARRWMKDNGATSGEWKENHRIVTLALSPAVQRAYYLYWSVKRPDEFQACKLCPHLEEQPEQEQ